MEKVISKDLTFTIRPNTTDIKVVDEVIKRNVYEHKKFGFFIKDCPLWLDLGGNIGTFTSLAASKGCRVITFEPEPDNFNLLLENTKQYSTSITYMNEGVVAGQSGTLELYICKGDYNKYRHTIFKKRGRSSITIAVKNFKETLSKYHPNGIKIDIEGAEIELLESIQVWPNFVTHIVFEYSFDIDPSIKRFKSIIDNLRTQFDVFHRNVDFTAEKWNFYPQAILVYCKRNLCLNDT
jgi:FkbM family methyltransferase